MSFRRLEGDVQEKPSIAENLCQLLKQKKFWI